MFELPKQINTNKKEDKHQQFNHINKKFPYKSFDKTVIT